MKVLLASDHAGFELKNTLVSYLDELGYEVVDMGPASFDESDDYPDMIAPLANEISRHNGQGIFGIVIGGSGQGEAIVANRFQHVRAGVYYGHALEEVKKTREHNDANVLSLGARFIKVDEAKKAVKTFLETPFSEEPRHERRIKEIDEECR